MKTVPLDFKIETERLTLCVPEMGELDFVWEATRYPSFNDGMVWDKPEAKEDLCEFAISIPKRWELGESFTFTFRNRSTQEPLGRIAVEESKDGWSIGYWTHPRYQSAGYATEALQSLLPFCFETLALEQVVACHVDWNIASRKVLERNGFTFKCRVEQGMKKEGEWVAENVLALTRDRWRKLRCDA